MISRQGCAWCQLQSSEVLHHVTYIYQIFQKNLISRKGRWPIFNMIGFICDTWHTFDYSPHTIGHSWSINPSIQQTVSHWPFFWAAVYLMHSGNYGQCAWLHATDKSINSFTTQYKYICLVCQMCLPGLQMYLWHLSTPSVQRAWLRAASQLIHPFTAQWKYICPDCQINLFGLPNVSMIFFNAVRSACLIARGRSINPPIQRSNQFWPTPRWSDLKYLDFSVIAKLVFLHRDR